MQPKSCFVIVKENKLYCKESLYRRRGLDLKSGFKKSAIIFLVDSKLLPCCHDTDDKD